MNYETTAEIEIAVAYRFGIRQNVIVPNVSWAIFNDRECDLVILNKNGYCSEVEIKISRSDLVKDKEKWHHHNPGTYFKYLWFALPEKLEKDIIHVPNQAGILIVLKNGVVKQIRQSQINNRARKLSYEDRYKLARLGAIRIWDLKSNVQTLKRKRLEDSRYEEAVKMGKYCV